MPISPYQRYCLDLQGYADLDDERKLRIDLAQRFKPAVCAAVAIFALVTGSAVVAFLASVLGFWGALLPGHPADLVYNLVLRPAAKAPELTPDPVPRRFACGMAGLLLLIGAIFWLTGPDVVGTVLVAMTVAALLMLVIADFCLGSFAYWLLVRRRIFLGSRS